MTLEDLRCQFFSLSSKTKHTFSKLRLAVSFLSFKLSTLSVISQHAALETQNLSFSSSEVNYSIMFTCSLGIMNISYLV